jgi:Chaperone of endosialidase
MVEKMRKTYFIFHFALCILNYSHAQEYTPYQLIGDIKDFNFGLALEVNSTTLSSRPCPNQTDAQRLINDALTPPQEGDCYFSTDQKKQLNYNGTTWASSGGTSILPYQQNHDYKTNDLLIVERDLYIVVGDFTSGMDFNTDFDAGNFHWFSPTDGVGGLGLAPTIVLVPPNTVSVGAGIGVHVDPFTRPGRRDFLKVSFAGEDVVVPNTPNSYFFIRVLNDGSKEVVLGQPTEINHQDDIIVAIGALDSAGEIFTVEQFGWIGGLTDSKVQDLVYISDVRNVKDNLFNPVAGTLNLSKTAGQIFSLGVNPASPRFPNTFESIASNPLNFHYGTSDNLIAGNTGIAVDPNRYQPNGVGPLVNVTANKFSVQRIYMSVRGIIVIEYGQKLYNTIQEALSDLNIFPYVVNPILANKKVFLWAGFMVVKEGTIDLADRAFAEVANCGQYGCQGSGSTIASAANGDVLGPVLSVDDSVPRFDGTTGKIIQGSNVTVSDIPTVAPFTNELKISEVAVPVIRADGDTDNQQAGTLFLSQGDAYGYKLFYDALNTLDGLKIVNRTNNVETTQALFKQNAIYLGNQDNNVVDNVGDGGVIIVGPTGGINGGPHLQFNDNNDIYPIRQFLNWGHNNIWDCWDCFYDGANTRHSTANSSFRWTKNATDLILSTVENPTVNGTEAFSNRFWINETGATNIQMVGNNTSNPPVRGITLTSSNAQVVGNSAPGIFFGNGGTVTSWMTVVLADQTSDDMGRFHFWDTAGGFSNRELLNMDFSTAVFADNVSAVSWTTRSDARLKKNIAEIPKSEVDKFNSLRPVMFNWQDKPFESRKKGEPLTDKERDNIFHYGFIAQEIEELYPNIVREDESIIYSFGDNGDVVEEKIMAKEYSMADMLAITVKALQDASKRIETLENEVKAIKDSQGNVSKPSPLPAKKPIKISSKPAKPHKKPIENCCPLCPQKIDKTQLEMQNEYLKEKMEKAEREIKSLKEIQWWIRH